MGCLEKSLKSCGAKAVLPGRCIRTVNDIEELNELFRNDPQPHPSDKPRPSKSKISYSTIMVRSSSSTKAFKEMVTEELPQDHVKKYYFILTQKKIKELMFLAIGNEGMTEEDATTINKIKDKIRAKYF